MVGTNRITPMHDWKNRVYLAMVAYWLKTAIAKNSGLSAAKKIGSHRYGTMIAETRPTRIIRPNIDVSPFKTIPSIGMDGCATDSLRKFLIAQNLVPQGIKGGFLHDYDALNNAFEWLVNGESGSEEPGSHCCLLCLITIDEMKKNHALGIRRQSTTEWELLEPDQGLFITSYPNEGPLRLLLAVLEDFHLHFIHQASWWVMFKVSS
ncbi:hypothetical protein [Endozoicomonas euniceicola]|uniref:Uncharacterized protein n=1 Tax=Endozoicomonas euniceicola TaxID=1234143 RepID=A0ABY6GNI7_9GAMM|nr:hypothetical protein [Endozoicomonas euniceicola]UYM14087.1 hypothetical protein NX720_14340 [Endozoicomonas euniceicola]